MKITKILKALKDTIKGVIDKIRKSKAIDKGEELLLTAVLPVIVSQVSKGTVTLSSADANKYAKEIVKGLNTVGDMAFGASVDLDAINGMYPPSFSMDKD